MAKASKRVTAKSLPLPKGFKQVAMSGTSWNYKENPRLMGTVQGFRDQESTKYFDYIKDKKTGARKKVPKVQWVAEIVDADGVVYSVYESAGLRALRDVEPGTEVCLTFLGLKKLAGKDNPMREFSVAVKE